jgi:hypothetical protein
MLIHPRKWCFSSKNFAARMRLDRLLTDAPKYKNFRGMSSALIMVLLFPTGVDSCGLHGVFELHTKPIPHATPEFETCGISLLGLDNATFPSPLAALHLTRYTSQY